MEFEVVSDFLPTGVQPQAINEIVSNFQNNFKVYGREGDKIRGYKIKKEVLYGRSTFFCPEIQK